MWEKGKGKILMPYDAASPLLASVLVRFFPGRRGSAASSAFATFRFIQATVSFFEKYSFDFIDRSSGLFYFNKNKLDYFLLKPNYEYR
jgi:hypothetical protein